MDAKASLIFSSYFNVAVSTAVYADPSARCTLCVAGTPSNQQINKQNSLCDASKPHKTEHQREKDGGRALLRCTAQFVCVSVCVCVAGFVRFSRDCFTSRHQEILILSETDLVRQSNVQPH